MIESSSEVNTFQIRWYVLNSLFPSSVNMTRHSCKLTSSNTTDHITTKPSPLYIILSFQPDNRANIFSRGIFRWMPLHYAAREAQPEVVKAILARIPNAEARREHINATDKKMRTPLWLAIFNNTNDTECRELVRMWHHDRSTEWL